uniref:BZIP domain-containing protein n=2 Tax=Wuchereria bancrofti TaxID=6293 RepID=A0A1I8EEU0_WUCBA
MDFDDSYCYLENNFDQFHLMNLLPPSDSGINLNSTNEQRNDQLSEIIDNLGLELNSQGNNGVFVTDDSSIFDTVTLDNHLINQIFSNNASPSTSDSGNYSPTYSTSDDQNAPDNDRIINFLQAAQINQLETKFIATPNPSRLVPVQIPLQQIVTNGKSTSSHPVICIMPAATHSISVSSQPAANQDKQRILSPKHEGLSSAFTSTPFKNVNATVFTPVNNLFNALSSGVAHYRRPERSTKMNIHFVDYDRKKEDRKIRNRYSAQLSRIRKKNEIDEMKRNLANKDAIIEKLKNKIEILNGTIEILRRENEMLKSNASNRNSGDRLSMLTGAVCLFGFVSLLNLDPIPDATSLVALNFAKSSAYFSQNRINTGRALLSLDYDGGSESRGNSQSNKKSDPLSQSNLNYSAKCDSMQKRYLNQTEAMKLNNDVFAWINRHECLQFVHVRHIFRVPINGGLTTPNITVKSVHDAATRKIKHRENRQQRTANDKIEAARLKAIRERTWRHIDMISSTADNTAIKSQVKTMDYNVMSSEHFLTNWLQDKTDALTVLDMESQYAELARNLKQREDTLYIVAMKNYYLLPATDRNGTMQPRMALILPALSFNGTLPNQVAMMRLECDITGTGLFHLPSSLLPLFYDRSAHQ